jgi:hypothetical protein
MTLGGLAHAALAGAIVAGTLGMTACGGSRGPTTDVLETQVAALEAERESLRERLNTLILTDERLALMPETPVRIGIPASLSRDLIQRIITGFTDQVVIELRNLEVRTQGTIRRIVTLGHYDLRVTVNRLTGTIKTGTPVVAFGDNVVSLSMPLSVTAGSGRATIHFVWDGRNVANAVCGDLDITQVVTGRVRPRTYPIKARLALAATTTEVLATPQFPTVRINLGVIPSAGSWAAFQKVLDDKKGLCGFVLDRIDVLESVRELIDRGFSVRLPTEKLKAAAIPVSIEPSMLVNGTLVALGIRVGELSVTEHAIWLGAHVSVEVGEPAVR